MKSIGMKMKKFREIKTVILIIIVVGSFSLVSLSPNFSNYTLEHLDTKTDRIHSSAETVYNQEWLKNNDFSTQAHWYSSKGSQGDNSTVDASIGGGTADYIVLGDDQTKEISAPLNDGTWVKMKNDIFLYPDTAIITSEGCYVDHQYDEGVNQSRNYHSVHWKKNVSMGIDMSKFSIDSASLEAIFNATVDTNVDVANDGISPQFGIGDFATFYVLISDLDFTNPYRVANNRTSTLGQDFPPITTIADKPIETVDEEDIITALSSSLDKDPDHANFTITLGIDIYCEDNFGTDADYWDALMIKTLNLTFSYKRKVEQFSSVSWNQVGNTISGSNIHISDANLKFRYRIDQNWPTSLSPFSEIRIIINNNQNPETVRLSSATTSWQDAKVGGFDVTNLIEKDANISVTLQVFMANTFSLDSNVTISIDDVYLNITYVETFADYGTEAQLFLESVNKTLDPFLQVVLGNTVNITVKFLENQTRTHISGASVQLTGKVSGQIDESGQKYTRVIDSTNLGVGIWSLTATAQKSNYETQIISFFVKVVDHPTELQLFVDDVNKTLDPTVDKKYNEVMNITVFYRNIENGQHIGDANVTITSLGDISEDNEQYTIIFNSNMLSFGFNVLTITAQSENYSSQMMQLYVEVYERATTFELEVDEQPKSNDDPIQIEVNTALNLTVFYKDDETGAYLTGALVTLINIGNFSQEIGNQFNYTLNSNDLSLGFNVLTIIAQFGNYQTQNFQIYVEVYNIASNLTLEINGTQIGALQIINVEVDQFKNFTVYYRDNMQQHISGAIVSLSWKNFSVNLTEFGSQYYYNLDTNDLEQGITIITIEAQLTDYQSQSIQIYIEVTERDTVLEVYMDSMPIFATQTINATVNQVLNITVFYRDDLTSQHLSGADVTVQSNEYIYSLNETGNQYSYSLNTNDPLLGEGITIVTIIGLLNNYQPRSFQFYVKVSKRASNISLYLNSIIKTDDPVLNLAFGKDLNVTVLYLDNLVPISGATVQLINKADPNDFYDLIELGNQYTLELDTSVLRVGVNLFTLVAWANNYQAKTLSLRITLTKISTIINTSTGERFFSIKPNKPFMMSIELTDIEGGSIINAIVTYRWAYGQGNLTDPDNNGIYEAELTNIPTGTYEIIIEADAGDYYSFEIYRITLTVESETRADFTLLFISLAGGLVALVVAFTLYQVRFKYPPLVRKSRKIRKKISKGKKTKPIKEITSRDDLIKERIESNVKTIQLEKKTDNRLKEK